MYALSVTPTFTIRQNCENRKWDLIGDPQPFSVQKTYEARTTKKPAFGIQQGPLISLKMPLIYSNQTHCSGLLGVVESYILGFIFHYNVSRDWKMESRDWKIIIKDSYVKEQTTSMGWRILIYIYIYTMYTVERMLQFRVSNFGCIVGF